MYCQIIMFIVSWLLCVWYIASHGLLQYVVNFQFVLLVSVDLYSLSLCKYLFQQYVC
jgi:hypothetical protein